jgi:hypothetical protein
MNKNKINLNQLKTELKLRRQAITGRKFELKERTIDKSITQQATEAYCGIS